MKTRVISGLAMLPLLLVVIAGGYVIAAVCFILALAALHEFYKGFNNIEIKPSFIIGIVSTAILYMTVILHKITSSETTFLNMDLSTENTMNSGIDWLSVGVMIWLFLTVMMSLLFLFKIEKRKAEDAMSTLTGILYISFFSVHIPLIDFSFASNSGSGLSLDGMSGFIGNPVWLIFITAFCSDIFAYFSGYFFGKHKLCPVISPKKTVEGAIGGVAGTVVVSALFGYFCLSKEHLIAWIVIGLVGSIMSMFGDLTASIFKRKMSIKDYGKLIPGHGGVLDRIDSVLFTAPVVYYSLLIYELIYMN